MFVNAENFIGNEPIIRGHRRNRTDVPLSTSIPVTTSTLYAATSHTTTHMTSAATSGVQTPKGQRKIRGLDFNALKKSLQLKENQ